MMEQEHLIDLSNISKDYDGTTVLSNINLYVRKKEFVTLLGPSGCGKTTTLRIIGGFEYPTTGTVYFEGQDVTALPPYKRQVNTVFQKYALFPHLNVRDNIAFGLNVKNHKIGKANMQRALFGKKTEGNQLQKLSRKEIDKKVDRMLELVNLKGYGKRSVDQLSGGQQQRIAIARALVNEPEVLLLDEPLGALDLKLRKEMQLELKSMQQQLGITFIYVTHDQEEALTMSDTVVVMRDGHILQIGDPKRIYDEPANAFVADFIGESNILRGTMVEDELVNFCGVNFPCVDSGFGENVPVDVVVRPEDIMIVGEDIGQLTGTVQSVLFKGVHYEMMIDTGDTVLKVHSTVMQPQGSRVGINIVPYNIHIMKPMDDVKSEEEAEESV
ncbi:MAG: ABC transporter ATP-binding protein [Clostridia bacterium]|nr:ABC transporter ATP-binding protein [Clostridia bacterium]